MIYLYVINYRQYNIGDKLLLNHFNSSNLTLENRIKFNPFINDRFYLSHIYERGHSFSKLSIDNDGKIIDIYSYSLNEIKKFIMIMD